MQHTLKAVPLHGEPPSFSPGTISPFQSQTLSNAKPDLRAPDRDWRSLRSFADYLKERKPASQPVESISTFPKVSSSPSKTSHHPRSLKFHPTQDPHDFSRRISIAFALRKSLTVAHPGEAPCFELKFIQNLQDCSSPDAAVLKSVLRLSRSCISKFWQSPVVHLYSGF